MQFVKNLNVLATGWLVLAGASAARAEITVTEWCLTTIAREHLSSSETVVEDTVAFPYKEVHTATDGPTTAQSAYDFTLDEHGASFDFLFNYSRGGTQYSRSESIGWITFVTSEPLEYNLGGSFTLSGTRRIMLDVDLVDLSAYGGDWVYRGWHESNATPDESFTLGVPGGDVVSQEIGDLSGMLTPGIPYQLQYYHLIENYPFDPGGAATAEGMLSFTLTPEPGTLVLLGIGGLALMRRDRARS